MKISKILTLIMGLLFLFSFTAKENFKTIKSQGVSIQYPLDWESLEIKGYPILVKEKAKSTEYAVLCNFVVEIDYISKTIDEYIMHWKTKMSTNEYIKDWKIESQKEIKYKGHKGHEFITTCSASGYRSKIKIVIIQQADRIVNLNTSSSELDFEKNRSITDQIYESVKFEKRK